MNTNNQSEHELRICLLLKDLKIVGHKHVANVFGVNIVL